MKIISFLHQNKGVVHYKIKDANYYNYYQLIFSGIFIAVSILQKARYERIYRYKRYD